MILRLDVEPSPDILYNACPNQGLQDHAKCTNQKRDSQVKGRDLGKWWTNRYIEATQCMQIMGFIWERTTPDNDVKPCTGFIINIEFLFFTSLFLEPPHSERPGRLTSRYCVDMMINST